MVSHEEGRKKERKKKEFEGLCLSVWRPQHLQHATLHFLNISSVHNCHDMCPWSYCDGTGKSETQPSKSKLVSGRCIKSSCPRLITLLFHLNISLSSDSSAALGQ